MPYEFVVSNILLQMTFLAVAVGTVYFGIKGIKYAVKKKNN